ncbi:uncharacterized protein EMH_0093940 [Eimeria mitis]|uniref:Uncharacterized protein n=1 Tax=Eimeria mitis TaxID=44415 RepID=U6KFH3_9EIME|nr:uncharacterized protein EMH_0093940 [Eimeria mitis]CDJ36699.1 hypothetical protein, conserved [Eimeria mitis]
MWRLLTAAAAPLLLLFSHLPFSSLASNQSADFGGGDLTADARLVTEHVELLAWYLQNDRLAVAHVAICLLEGPHKEISRAVIDKCQGDYEFIRYSVKDFIVDLPRSSVRLAS